MNKEQLIALGLTEEQANSVVTGFGQMIPKSRLDEKIEEVKGLNATITERDGQLEELKKVDAKGLQAKIDELQSANETAKTEYEEKMQKQSYDFALERALADAKVKNPKAVKALLDTEAIKLDGEKLLGLDEQLKTLAESDGYLFAEKEEANSVFRGFTPTDGKKADAKEKDTSEDFGKSLAQLAAGNADLDKARDSYFG